MFLTFAAITLLGAVLMLLMRNLVLAALSLVLSFVGLAGLFVLLANPVAAMLQIIVYSGAIVVLVLFVIMLLNEHREEPPEKSRPVQCWASLLVIAGLGFAFFKLLGSSMALQKICATAAGRKGSLPMVQMERIGNCLVREQVLSFEVTGLILLSAMIAAVTLVKREL